MVDLLLIKVFFSVFFIVTSCIYAEAFDVSDVSAKSAVVINAETKEIVFEKNAYEKRSMASTTKIMTALLACESGRLYETVEITPSMCGAEGTSVGLKAGNKIKLYDLVAGMMLESGNDAANAVAIFLGGSIEGFSRLMNQRAYSIGMKCTNFVTPSGLDDENHYTIAYDMALLGAEAVKNLVFKSICSQKRMSVDFISPEIRVTYSNHNKLLGTYEGVYGIKTGFTKKSGRCLVSAAENENGNFICVTLSACDDWNDHAKMFDYAFGTSVKKEADISIPEYVLAEGGVFSKLRIKTDKTCTLFFKSESKIEQRIYLPSFIYAPVKKGDIVGWVEMISDNKSLLKIPIIAAENLSSAESSYDTEKTLIEKIKDILHIKF